MAIFTSATQEIPASAHTPRHVAIIMDGNGRWALARGWPRVTGHSRGVDAVRATLGACGERGIEYLTLFAFSSENWRRPADEVSTLMRLFMVALQREVDKLVELGVRMRVVGETFAFDADLRRLIAQSEQRTAHNTRLHLTICANYGGRWDIAQAAERAAKEQLASGARNVRIDESAIAQRLSLSFAPEPDLLIRTGGERRISNFLLWQLAYAELYFSDVLWPDFNAAELESALRWYAGRQRRFGMTGEQIESEPSISDAA
ncbi:MAG: polyprenyl diphosphate synthase [Betaproteobacteria bacterium]